ncbi:MAG: tetratricopeptide repeat protein [Proteobacteria bacterium]|nr:tetratricopeptide repeat protein [Pseudomonadota bacterium]
MSFLYRTLTRALQRKQRESDPLRQRPVSSAEKKQEKRKKGSPFRLALLSGVLLISAMGAAGLFLWPERESVVAPSTQVQVVLPVPAATAVVPETVPSEAAPRRVGPPAPQQSATALPAPARDETTVDSPSASDRSIIPTAPTLAPPEPPQLEPVPTPPAQAAVGGVFVYLAPYRSRESAIEGWALLREAHADLLGGLDHSVVEVDLDQQGMFFRVQVGLLASEAEANALCARLKSRDLYCALAPELVASRAEPTGADESLPVGPLISPTVEDLLSIIESAPIELTPPAPEATIEAPAPAQAGRVASEPGPTGAEGPPPALPKSAQIELTPTAPEATTEAPADETPAEAAAMDTLEAAGAPIRIEQTLGQVDSAISQMVTVTDESDDVRDRYEAAQRSLRAGQADAALWIYQELLRHRPADRPALLGRAIALQRLNRFNDAIRAYEEVLRHHPDELVALTNLLGLIGREAPDEALEQLGRLYAVNPGYSPMVAQISLIYARLNDTPNAVRFMREAITLDPTNAVYHLNLAVLYDRAGQKPAAVRSYERTLELAAGEDKAIPISAETIRERLRYLATN